MFIGSQGRFSTDLDFTGLEEHDHEDVILAMMGAFEGEFHGIKFNIPDNSYYETMDGLSWGVNPTYAHEWNGGGDSEIKLQVSRRETPTLAPARLPQLKQSYFDLLPFAPAEIDCPALPEILAEKIRACYQRNKARDIFDPVRLMEKFEHGTEFDWDDLRDLVRRDARIDRQRICDDCVRGFRFLGELTAEERTLAGDPHQRERALREKLRL